MMLFNKRSPTAALLQHGTLQLRLDLRAETQPPPSLQLLMSKRRFEEDSRSYSLIGKHIKTQRYTYTHVISQAVWAEQEGVALHRLKKLESPTPKRQRQGMRTLTRNERRIIQRVLSIDRKFFAQCKLAVILGDEARSRRKAAGWLLPNLAAACGLPDVVLYALETNTYSEADVRQLTREVAKRLFATLNWSPWDFGSADIADLGFLRRRARVRTAVLRFLGLRA